MKGPESMVDCESKPKTLKVEEGFETGNTRHQWDLAKFRASHRVLAEMRYEKRKVSRGYAGRTLYVNLTRNEIKEKPVSEEMKQLFTGGKGFDLKLLKEGIKPTTRWDSDENELVLAAGPICGTTQYSGMGKCLAATISPLTNIPCDSNAGGFFAPYMKFAGFDAIEIQGKAKEDVVVIIDGNEGRVTIETAPLEDTNAHLVADQLTHLYAAEDTGEARQKVAVVSAGKGAEHSFWGCLNISFYDLRRKVARLKQHGRGGLGTVFRNKGLKALVARIEKFDGLSNGPADVEKIVAAGLRHHRELRDLDPHQCCMREVGTVNIVEVMDAYDLLPTENYRFGSHPKASNLHSPQFYKRFTQVIPDGCWFGCTMACAKVVDGFTVMTGPYKGMRFSVDGPEYENSAGCANMGLWDPDWVIEWNFYCDCYGIDTISFATGMAFYMEMYEYGILSKERCDGLELVWGNGEAILEFLHRMARGDKGEFQQVASKGTRRTKDWLISKGWGDPEIIENCGMENKGLEFSEYVCKESLAQQGGYGLTNKGPQHDEAWLIFMDMVNNQIPTFADKAEALHYFPMWRTWFGLVGLCKLPWNDVTPVGNSETAEPAKVPEHVQNYCDVLGGVTGREYKPSDLIEMSEKVYNWQRAMNVWMGRGTRADDRVPLRAIGPVTELEYRSRHERYEKQLVEKVKIPRERLEKMHVRERLQALQEYRRDQYQKLADAVYFRRGWTPNGIPTPQKMKALGFGAYKDILAMLQRRIDEDERAGLNTWGGKYGKGEKPPSTDPKYWEKW
jgi:aldehyde:ferredoxin oxidoreductase